MADSEELFCGACGESINRTDNNWVWCDECGDAIHTPKSCGDVWHPHEQCKFCGKACARRFLKSAGDDFCFELQQRMPPAPSTSSAAAPEPAAVPARAFLEQMLQESQERAARNATARAVAEAETNAMLEETAPELAAMTVNPICAAIYGGSSAPSSSAPAPSDDAAPAAAADAADAAVAGAESAP